MKTRILAAAAFFGMTAVIFGAFGAHALKKVLDVQQLSAFETGVRYQMYHAFLLFFIGITGGISDKIRNAASWLVIAGIFLFSGSIYLLSTQTLHGFNASFLGPVTPIGGLLLIVAWFLLFIDFVRKKS